MEDKSNNVSRMGFTAVEMMVVVSIVIILVAMVVPTIGPAMRRGAVHDSANAIQRACSQARQLARSNSEPDGSTDRPLKWYGVAVVVPDSSEKKPAYAVVIYGDKKLTDFSFANDSGHHYPNGTPLLDGTGGFYGDGVGGGPLRKAAAKFPLSRSVMPFQDDKVPVLPALPAYAFMTPGSAIGWYYQYRTCFVFMDPTKPGVGVDIGVPAGSAPQNFGVASLDKKYVVAIAVYKISLLNMQDAN